MKDYSMHTHKKREFMWSFLSRVTVVVSICMICIILYRVHLSWSHHYTDSHFTGSLDKCNDPLSCQVYVNCQIKRYFLVFLMFLFRSRSIYNQDDFLFSLYARDHVCLPSMYVCLFLFLKVQTCTCAKFESPGGQYLSSVFHVSFR